jgi:nucleotide-binding universal stress UspA family protein
VSFADVLVFADGAEYGVARVQMAWDIAKPSGAHLEAQILVPLPMQPYGVTTPSLDRLYFEVVADEEARAATAVSALREVAPVGEHFSAHARSIPAFRTHAAAATASRSADLVILGQPEAKDDGLQSDILRGALFSGGAPCLMFPRWIKPHVWGRRALIAWKGAPEAARALRAAMPFLVQAESVCLLIVNPRGEWAGEDQRALSRLATHLARHGVKLEQPVVINADDLDHGVERAIGSELERFNSDLLVLGAYGHSRWSEIAFGGVSQGMIFNSQVAVLLAH